METALKGSGPKGNGYEPDERGKVSRDQQSFPSEKLRPEHFHPDQHALCCSNPVLRLW
jgi:hypothetical protein